MKLSFRICLMLLLLSNVALAQRDVPSTASIKRLRDAHVTGSVAKTYELPDTSLVTNMEFSSITDTRTGFQIKTIRVSDAGAGDTMIVDYTKQGLVRAIAKRSSFSHELTRFRYDSHDSLIEQIESSRRPMDTSSGTEQHEVNTFDAMGHHLKTERFTVGAVRKVEPTKMTDQYYYDTTIPGGNWICDSMVTRDEDGHLIQSTSFQWNSLGQMLQQSSIRSLPDGRTDSTVAKISYDQNGKKKTLTMQRSMPVMPTPEEMAKITSSGSAPPPPSMRLQSFYEEHFDQDGNSIDQFTFGPDGKIMGTTKRSYNTLGEIRSETHRVNQIQQNDDASQGQNSTNVDMLNYTYDKNGNLVRTEDFHNDALISFKTIVYSYPKK